MADGDQRGAFVVEVTGFEQDRRVAFDTVEGPFDWKSDFRLDPQGDGLTKITSSGEVTLRGARRLLQPVAADKSGGVRRPSWSN